MIYWIRVGEYVKVGYTNNLERRLREYDTHNPLEVELFLCSVGSRKDEKALHKILEQASRRVEGKREWYHIEGLVELYLKSYEDEVAWNKRVFGRWNADDVRSHWESKIGDAYAALEVIDLWNGDDAEGSIRKEANELQDWLEERLENAKSLWAVVEIATLTDYRTRKLAHKAHMLGVDEEE